MTTSSFAWRRATGDDYIEVLLNNLSGKFQNFNPSQLVRNGSNDQSTVICTYDAKTRKHNPKHLKTKKAVTFRQDRQNVLFLRAAMTSLSTEDQQNVQLLEQ